MEDNKSPVAWFHCASLGEFEQARPIMEIFRKEYPHYAILLTFFSPSGYQVRKKYELAKWIYYLPMDTPKNSREFIKIVNPKVAFFIKYEYWYNLLNEAHKKKIPVISASSIFRPDQMFFKKRGAFFLKILGFFHHFFVQDERSLELLKKAGIKNVSKAGDTRFDRVKGIRDRVQEIPLAAKFAKGHKVMVAGSCWPEDMDVLTPFINEREDLKFILAPHNISDKFMRKLELELMRDTVRFSKASLNNITDYSVLIIDNIGMLSSLYQYGDYAYVGGAFGQGLHNILEPATFGIPVFFGNKNYKKFKEAIDLANLGSAFAVANYSEFRSKFNHVSNPSTYEMIEEITTDYILNNTGATDIIMAYCRKNLDL